MRYTILHDGEPVGEVNFPNPRVPESWHVDFEPLPGFERVRPILERGQQLIWELTFGMHPPVRGKSTSSESAPSASPLAPTPPPVAKINGFTRPMTPEEFQSLSPADWEAVEAMRALRFTVQDESGALVPGAEVFIWTTALRPKSGPLVALIWLPNPGDAVTA